MREKALLDVAEFAHEKTIANVKTIYPHSPVNTSAWSVSDPLPPIPFVISVEQWTVADVKAYTVGIDRTYYVWFFGLKVRLPYKGPPRQIPKRQSTN